MNNKVALDAVHTWGLGRRFSFGVGPTKSVVAVFGSLRRRPDCKSWEASPCLWCRQHRTPVCLNERLLVFLSSSAFVTGVQSSASFGLKFVGDVSAALQQFNLSFRGWCRRLLLWPTASPVPTIHWELGWRCTPLCPRTFVFSLFGLPFHSASWPHRPSGDASVDELQRTGRPLRP